MTNSAFNIYKKFFLLLSFILVSLSCTRVSKLTLDKDYSVELKKNGIIDVKNIVVANHYKNRFYEITYLSDGIKVKGIISLPRGFDTNKKWPVVFYSRGGNRDLGMIKRPGAYFDKLTLDKFILFASQYRGSKGSEGRDEFGGKDVFDIINLIEISKKFSFIDKSKRFAVGESRGAMMNFLVMKEGIQFTAAASIGGLTDLTLTRKHRPEMEKRVFSELIPQYKSLNEDQKLTELKKRSAIFWPEKIQTPLVILHGEEDWQVRVDQAQNMAKKLKEKGLMARSVFFKDDDHLLSKNKHEVVLEVQSWFDRFR